MFEEAVLPGADARLETAGASPRPSLPVLLVCGLSFWCGVVACEALAWTVCSGRTSPPVALSLLATGLLGAGGGVASLRFQRRGHPLLSTVFICLTFACAGLFCASVAWGEWESSREFLSAHGSSGRHELTVTDDSVEGQWGSYSEAVLHEDGRNVPVRLYWRSASDAQPAGSRIQAFGTLEPVEFDEAGHTFHRRGTVGTLKAHSPQFVGWEHSPSGHVAPWRKSLVDAFTSFGDGGQLLAGVVTGNREGLRGTRTEEAFAACGLSHLLAVSGSHLAVVAAISSWVCALFGARRSTSFACTTALVVAYLFVSGLQVSAIRAAIMSETGLCALVAGRRKNAGAALGVALVAILATDPPAAFSVSLRLSALSVLGMLYLAPLVANWLQVALRGPARRLVPPVAATLAAQATTLPATAELFGRISLIAPLANVLVAPLVDLLLLAGLLATPFVLLGSPLARPLCALAATASGLVCRLVEQLARVPLSSVATGVQPVVCAAVTFCAAAALWFWWPRPRLSGLVGVGVVCCLAALVVIVPAFLPVSPRLVMLDVGQGDAILVRSGRKTLLVDAGRDHRVLEEALARQHVRHLDAVVVTHLHDDHYGGLVSLSSTIGVDAVYLPAPMLERFPDHEALEAARTLVGSEQVHGLSCGDRLVVDAISLSVLWPEGLSDRGGNADSLCLRLSFDAQGDGVEEASGLLCGDAESDVTGKLADEGLLGTIDLLKVGHHGSETSTSRRLLEQTRPRIALVSVGADNDYGHPDPVCLDNLEQAGVQTLRTDRSGDVTVRLDDRGMLVTCATMAG
ncbi:MAG: DNA internalization-related competence protein ComEC/Rec2 [Coriobacteriales bacterium]